MVLSFISQGLVSRAHGRAEVASSVQVTWLTPPTRGRLPTLKVPTLKFLRLASTITLTDSTATDSQCTS
jgi:hypothetical protein